MDEKIGESMVMHVSIHHCTPVHLRLTFITSGSQPGGTATDRIIFFKRLTSIHIYSQISCRDKGIFMEITTTNRDTATILSIAGRIDTATAPALEQAINQEIERQHRKILLDFSAVSYISSGGLRVLLSTAKKLKNPGDKFALCSLSPEVMKILRLAGFTSIFSICPTQEEALAGW
jgi:anti-sigma B factor antagonist